jgi:nuclear cap-binding protein subunit 1
VHPLCWVAVILSFFERARTVGENLIRQGKDHRLKPLGLLSYLGLMRELVARPGAPAALLRIVFKFWAQNRQFAFIVFDRLLQYRVVNPPDVLAWVFNEEEERDWSDIANWDVLRSTLERVGSRVKQLTARLQTLKKTEEAKADADRAAGKGP